MYYNIDERISIRLSRILKEDDTGRPLNSERYPTVRYHKLAKYTPSINVEKEVGDLKKLAFKYPPGEDPPDLKSATVALRRAQYAFNRLLQRLQLNPMSGLRGESEYTRLSDIAAKSNTENIKKGLMKSNYIVIAADVDNMKYLNDKTGLGHRGVNAILQYIGELFRKHFNIENTKLFHPHGDEFRVISYIGDLDQHQSIIRFIRLLQGCIEVANKLASTGFYQEDWPENMRIQPTMSFGISNTDQAADGLLTYLKSKKDIKYVIVVDKNLRHSLGLSSEDIDKYINSIRPKQSDAKIITLEPPDVLVHESKDNLDRAKNSKGVIIVEASWEDNPHKEEINDIIKQKRRYLDFPEGVMKVGDKFIPLKEKFKP